MTSLREQIVAAAARQTVELGWAGVTMSLLADEVGVSRKTVYNEVGTKTDLAGAIVLYELGTFIELVEAAFAAHPDDAVGAIRDSVESVLRYAQESPLLRAIVSSAHGADTGLVPLLTTHPAPMMDLAAQSSMRFLGQYDLPLTEQQVAMTSEMFTRAVISQVMYPTSTPSEVGDHMAWVLESTIASARVEVR